MDDTINLGLTKEQAAQLNELLEQCLQELRASEEEMQRRQLRIDALEAETNFIIARMKQRMRDNQKVEAML